jgi:hypothetical protein
MRTKKLIVKNCAASGTKKADWVIGFFTKDNLKTQTLISTSTPLGNSSFISASTVLALVE